MSCMMDRMFSIKQFIFLHCLLLFNNINYNHIVIYRLFLIDLKNIHQYSSISIDFLDCQNYINLYFNYYIMYITEFLMTIHIHYYKYYIKKFMIHPYFECMNNQHSLNLNSNTLNIFHYSKEHIQYYKLYNLSNQKMIRSIHLEMINRQQHNNSCTISMHYYCFNLQIFPNKLHS